MMLKLSSTTCKHVKSIYIFECVSIKKFTPKYKEGTNWNISINK